MIRLPNKSLAAGVLAAALCALTGATPAQSMDPADLAIWQGEDFRRQFAQSYLSETDIEPRVNEDERATMLEVLEMISSDQMREAEAVLEDRLAAFTDSSAVMDFTLANIRFQAEELEDAAAGYEAAVEKFPKFRRAWKNLAVIRVRQGDFEKALPALIRVVELGGNDAITHGLLGYAHGSLENHLAAESAYRMAVLLDPATKDWRMGLARSFFKQERYAEAISLTNQLLEEDPESTDLWLLQANARLGLGDAAEAARIYELVDLLGGSTVESLSMLGDIYVNDELLELAAQSYIRALEMDPANGIDRALRASKVLAARSALGEAQAVVDRLEQLAGDKLMDAQRKDILKLRARVAVAEGGGEQEARILEQIVELDPLDGEALILLGQHHARAGEPERAIFYYERASALDAFEADARVRHAQLLVAEGKYDEALPLLRRAQQVNYRENIQEYLEQVERVGRNK
jgi:tetratricopeptide (TPR) repeat protein